MRVGELWPSWSIPGSIDMNFTNAKEKSFCILFERSDTFFPICHPPNCIVEDAFLVQHCNLGPILKLAARKWSKFGGNSLSGCCPLGMRRRAAAGKKGDWMGERKRERTWKTRSGRGREEREERAMSAHILQEADFPITLPAYRVKLNKLINRGHHFRLLWFAKRFIDIENIVRFLRNIWVFTLR